MNATRCATRISLWRVNQKQSFFLSKNCLIWTPRLNKLMQPACHRRGIVTKYVVTVDGGLGAVPPASGRFLWYCSKQISNFNAILITFRTFWSHVSNQSCKSGRTFRVGFGPQVDKNIGLNSGLRRTFCFRCSKNNQNNLATLLNFSDLT